MYVSERVVWVTELSFIRMFFQVVLLKQMPAAHHSNRKESLSKTLLLEVLWGAINSFLSHRAPNLHTHTHTNSLKHTDKVDGMSHEAAQRHLMLSPTCRFHEKETINQRERGNEKRNRLQSETGKWRTAKCRTRRWKKGTYIGTCSRAPGQSVACGSRYSVPWDNSAASAHRRRSQDLYCTAFHWDQEREHQHLHTWHDLLAVL